MVCVYFAVLLPFLLRTLPIGRGILPIRVAHSTYTPPKRTLIPQLLVYHLDPQFKSLPILPRSTGSLCLMHRSPEPKKSKHTSSANKRKIHTIHVKRQKEQRMG